MADFNFEHVTKITDPTIWIELPEILGWDPVAALEVVLDSADNNKLRNARLLAAVRGGMTGKLAEAVRDGSASDEQQILALEYQSNELDADRDHYAYYVVKGWRNVRNGAGELVPFSAEACKALLHALPDKIFLRIRKEARKVDNFPGMPQAVSREAVAEVEKNS